jgi:hypothetical protein
MLQYEESFIILRLFSSGTLCTYDDGVMVMKVTMMTKTLAKLEIFKAMMIQLMIFWIMMLGSAVVE